MYILLIKDLHLFPITVNIQQSFHVFTISSECSDIPDDYPSTLVRNN